ncbi:lipase family protein [Agarilytica rhodophyticola]|uniref:lipase family protein n=1 Tax=Agarilytica rhodophyticola TaxID=1737490 RepID=UPI000B349367|nr:lipase family protein [Agarilytica rhodophyticola]
MSNILVSSTEELAEVEYLLSKKMPHYRQAYSDRTSWLMACIAELSYLKFNPIFKHKEKEYLVERVASILDQHKMTPLLKLIKSFEYDPEEERKKLEENADFLQMELKETFDNDGVQAILLESDTSIILAFRGTEPNSINDITTDFKSSTIPCKSGGKIHSGFSQAYDKVAVDIQIALDKEQAQHKPLFITGHSLGGALATIAAKKLTHTAGIAACYTYGSPRVADRVWFSDMKTPLYRIVNAADPVTMMPTGDELIGLLAWLSKFIPYIGDDIRNTLLSRFSGYYHGGDMRYLTNCPQGYYEDVKLLYSVSFLFRVKAFIVKKMPWSKILTDHSVEIYRKKLKIIAYNRQCKNTQ